MFNIGLKATTKALFGMIGSSAQLGEYKVQEYLEQEKMNRSYRDFVASEEGAADALEAIDETNQRLAKCKMTREELTTRIAAFQAARQV